MGGVLQIGSDLTLAAYGVGIGRTGVRQGGTSLDVCPVWVSRTEEDVGFFEGGGCDIRPNLDMAQ